MLTPDRFIQQMRARLAEFDAEMTDLRDTVDDSRLQDDTALENDLRTLQRQRDAFEEQILELETGSDAPWEGMREELEASWANLEAELARVRAGFQTARSRL